LNTVSVNRINFFAIFLLLIIAIAEIFIPEIASAQRFRSLNFEGAGYVTGLFPVKYNSNSLPGITKQVIYARTDIGGVYKSTNNGISWVFISNFRKNISPSELMIQGIAVKPKLGQHSTGDTILVAWGNNPSDAIEGGVYRSIWRSTNGGDTWERPTFEPPGLVFAGNCLKLKVGGECILYHPDSSNVLYAGGISPISTLPPILYKSTNGGAHWVKVNNVPFQTGDTIICISMLKGHPEIWIGTTRGIYRSTDYGLNWHFEYYHIPDVRRILFQKYSGNNFFAFIAGGGDSTTRFLTRYNSSDNSWIDLSMKFDSSIVYGGENGLTRKLFSALTLINDFDDSESMILAGRYERPLRLSSNYGSTWTGNGDPRPKTGSQVVFRYSTNSQNFPNHQYQSELSDFIYTGMNHVVQNPNEAYRNIWYCSGGAGAFKSEDGGIIYIDEQNHSTWQYTVNGMNIPVVYDILFDPTLQSYIQLPISDWTNAYTSYYGSLNYSKLNYDRQGTNIHICDGQPDYDDTYITNVTRVLRLPGKNNISYNIGGNVYHHRAKMYKRIESGMVLYHEICDLPWAFTPNRVLSDGIVLPLANHNYRLVVMLGASNSKHSSIEPGYSDLGIYTVDINSQSDFINVSKASFMGWDKDDLITRDAFEHSQITPLGTTSGLFTNQFNLAKSPQGKVFLYLEGIIGNQNAGGLFVSTDRGTNWQKVSDVVSNNQYKDEGCLRYHDGVLYVAIQNHGVYYSADHGNDTNWVFTRIEGFVSAEQVEVKKLSFNPGVKQIYVFGRRGQDRFNKIYRSVIDSSGSFSLWQEITGSIPGVNSLRINPDPLHQNELWIATAGQGVIIYEHPENQLSVSQDPIIAMNNSLEQNYPNPFNPVTNISFSLESDARINLTVFDISGRKLIEVLKDNLYSAGRHTIKFDGSYLPSGVYFYKLSTENFSVTKKMLLLK